MGYVQKIFHALQHYHALIWVLMSTLCGLVPTFVYAKMLDPVMTLVYVMRQGTAKPHVFKANGFCITAFVTQQVNFFSHQTALFYNNN